MYRYLHIEPVIWQDYLQNLFKGVRDLVAKFLDILKNNIKFYIFHMFQEQFIGTLSYISRHR